MSIPVICDRCRAAGTAGEADFSHLGDLLEFAPVPRKTKRADGWTPDRQRAFIAALSATGSKRQAALAIGMQPYGVDQLLKAEDNDSFKAAFERALAIAAQAGSMKIAKGVADAAARNAQLTPPSRLRGLALPGASDDPDSIARAMDEARDRISQKLLGARRLFLHEIADCPGRRAAFEILTGFPIDWDKAERLEAQADEPFRRLNARDADMVLTAENGWMGDIAHGPDKKAELRRQLNAWRVEQGLDPIEDGEWGESE